MTTKPVTLAVFVIELNEYHEWAVILDCFRILSEEDYATFVNGELRKLKDAFKEAQEHYQDSIEPWKQSQAKFYENLVERTQIHEFNRELRDHRIGGGLKISRLFCDKKVLQHTYINVDEREIHYILFDLTGNIQQLVKR